MSNSKFKQFHGPGQTFVLILSTIFSERSGYTINGPVKEEEKKLEFIVEDKPYFLFFKHGKEGVVYG